MKFLVANSAVEGAVWKVNSPVLGSIRSRNFCRKSMPKTFSLNSSASCTVWVHFLFFIKMSVLNPFVLSIVLPNAVSNALMLSLIHISEPTRPY